MADHARRGAWSDALVEHFAPENHEFVRRAACFAGEEFGVPISKTGSLWAFADGVFGRLIVPGRPAALVQGCGHAETLQGCWLRSTSRTCVFRDSERPLLYAAAPRARDALVNTLFGGRSDLVPEGYAKGCGETLNLKPLEGVSLPKILAVVSQLPWRIPKMKKRALAPVVAIAIAAGSIAAVGHADAQEFTAAELYEPRISGVLDLGPDERSAYLIYGGGPRVESVDLNLFESPYPGLKMERDTSPYSAPYRVKLRLEGGKIYPKSFDVLVGVTVHYDDGSSEYVEGPFTVEPLKALVAGEAAESVKPATSPRATVSVTATTTVTETETETVTATSTEFYPEPYPEISYETETVTVTETVALPVTTTETATSTEYYPEPYPDPYLIYETETETVTTTETETATSTEYYPEPYPEISYETETVTVTATETATLPVTTTNSAEPQPPRSSDGSLSHADIYEPEISSLGGYDIGPTASYAYLIDGGGPELDDVEILEFDSPYPLTYSLGPKNDLINHRTWIDAAIEQKKIYPAQFNVAVTARVIYKDGSAEEVSGLLPIRPIKTLVAENPVAPKTTSAPSSERPTTVTVTRDVEVPGDIVTVTATAEPLPPATVTSTKEAPAPATVTATVTQVQQVEVPGKPVTVTATADVIPVTVTETATVQETIRETATATKNTTVKATATVTKTAEADVSDSGSSLSTGGIVGLVLAILAALGAGAFVLSGGLPPQIAKALPF